MNHKGEFTFKPPGRKGGGSPKQVERPTAQSFYNFKHFMQKEAKELKRQESDGSSSSSSGEDDDFISISHMDPLPAGVPDNREYEREESDYYCLDPLSISLPTPPWLSKDGVDYSSNVFDFFQQEIEDFDRYMRPTPAEVKLRKLTVERLKRITDKIFPGSSLSAFGSFATGLYLPTSDIDLVLLEDRPKNVQTNLSTLENAVRKAGLASRLETVPSAKVPLLKYTDALTRYQVDVSFNIDNGIETARMIKRVLDAEGSDGALRPLIMILKTFLVQRNLNEVFTGGLGSYSILILLSSFLNVFLILVLTSQSHPRIVSGQISPWQNMSILLIEFFELFGGKGINVHAVGVGVDIDADDGKAAGFFLKKSVLTGPRTDMKLAIQDPQDAKNDVGRGSYGIRFVQSQFYKAYYRLTFIIGSYYELQKSVKNGGRRKGHPKKSESRGTRMKSVLGTIIMLGKNVLEHRDYVEETFSRLEANGWDEDKIDVETDDFPGMPTGKRHAKRKRSAESGELHDADFVDGTSSENSDLHLHTSKKPRKTAPVSNYPKRRW